MKRKYIVRAIQYAWREVEYEVLAEDIEEAEDAVEIGQEPDFEDEWQEEEPEIFKIFEKME